MVFSAFLRMTGLEPARAQCPLEPESSASASSATSAQLSALDYNNLSDEICQHLFLKFVLKKIQLPSFLLNQFKRPCLAPCPKGVLVLRTMLFAPKVFRYFL